MARDLYINQPSRPDGRFRRLLISLLLLSLLGGLAIGAWILVGNRQSEAVLNDFRQALSEQRAADAVALYRHAQELSRSENPLQRNQQVYAAAAEQMASQVDGMLDDMQLRLRGGKALGADQIALIEGLAEMTAADMTAWLRGLGSDYLYGRIERPVLDQAFAQLSALANIRPGLGDLPLEFENMAKARPFLMEAMDLLEQGEYWDAHKILNEPSEILKTTAAASPVVAEALNHSLAEIRRQMLPPLLREAESLLLGGRYQSAQAALQQLQRVFPADAELRRMLDEATAKTPQNMTLYSGPIEFIAVKPLIVDPGRALDGDGYAAVAADGMLTRLEFGRLLDQLYAKKYILIDSDLFYDSERRARSIRIPEGRKPLVLVIEELNYTVARRENGNAWDLVLDEQGEVCASYRDETGQMVVDRLGEAIGILDAFVAEHPDFALDGAKGTISLSGYECVFGQIVDADQIDDRNAALARFSQAPIAPDAAEISAARKQVTAVIERLKQTGWIFASSTYGFIDASRTDLPKLKTDTEKWFAQVGSLTGPISILHYPNGAYIRGSDPRAEYLKDKGFILFGGIGPTQYLFAGERYFYVDKAAINAVSLAAGGRNRLDRIAAPGSVIPSGPRR